MDIKLVKNFEDGKYYPINKDLLSQMINDNYQIDQFNGKKIFIFNPLTNERFDVLPEIKKFDMVNINYAAVERDYFMFTSATRMDDSMIKIDYYWYTINDGGSTLIYSQTVPVKQLGKSIAIKVIVLDENYCIFDTIHYMEDRTQKAALISRGKASHHMVLHDIASDKTYNLEQSVIAESGIDKVIPINGNMCAIKIGSSMIEEKMYEHIPDRECEKELIAVINVKQFVSELVLNLDNIYMDILDEGTSDITFPYMKQSSGYIVYSKVDVSKKIEEIIMYDYENKVKKVRLNSKISRVSDLSWTFVVQDIPYMIKHADKSTRIINLNTQKTELKLGADLQIRYIYNDIIVVEKHIKKMPLMRKENNYIVVYRFPDLHHSVFKTRARYKDCLAHYNDLLIFTN